MPKQGIKKLPLDFPLVKNERLEPEFVTCFLQGISSSKPFIFGGPKPWLLGAWMSQEVSKRLGSVGYNPNILIYK